MIWNLQPLWIVFSCVFSCKFIKINQYIQFLFLCVPKILFNFPNHRDTFLLYQAFVFFDFCCTKWNLADFFSEYIMRLILEPSLRPQYCFFILQSRFLILKFYFLFDPTLPCTARLPVNNSQKAICIRS